MVPRRPHQAQRRAIFAAKHPVDRVTSRAGRQTRHVERRRADDGVGVGPSAAACCEFVDRFHVATVMDTLDPLARRRLPFRPDALSGQSAAVQQGSNLPQPLGPLGMSPAGVVVEKSRIGIKQRHGTNRILDSRNGRIYPSFCVVNPPASSTAVAAKTCNFRRPLVGWMIAVYSPEVVI